MNPYITTSPNELFLYALFKNILSKSYVIDGRFIVAEGYGNDLNANNLDDVIKDALGGITTVKKYPLAVMMPPIDIVNDYDKGWIDFKCRMFFLTPSYNNGDSSIKSIDKSTNTSAHSIQFDWKDMRECSGDFRKVFKKLVSCRNLTNIIRDKQTPDITRRFSLMNNDRLSGVELEFEVSLFGGCEISDYDDLAIDQIIIPDFDVHLIHKH